MQTVIRVIISAVVGFFLMWPLGYMYGVLNWPTFHSWGLIHGTFFSAWPTLSILTFLALGYVPPFPRVEDTPLLIVGIVWGLLLTGFSCRPHLSKQCDDLRLLVGTAATVAFLSFFAGHKLRLTLLVVSPIVFLKMDFLLGLMSPHTRELKFLVYGALSAFHVVKRPLIFSFIGWGIGSVARASMRRSPV